MRPRTKGLRFHEIRWCQRVRSDSDLIDGSLVPIHSIHSHTDRRPSTFEWRKLDHPRPFVSRKIASPTPRCVPTAESFVDEHDPSRSAAPTQNSTASGARNAMEDPFRVSPIGSQLSFLVGFATVFRGDGEASLSNCVDRSKQCSNLNSRNFINKKTIRLVPPRPTGRCGNPSSSSPSTHHRCLQDVGTALRSRSRSSVRRRCPDRELCGSCCSLSQ